MNLLGKWIAIKHNKHAENIFLLLFSKVCDCSMEVLYHYSVLACYDKFLDQGSERYQELKDLFHTRIV